MKLTKLLALFLSLLLLFSLISCTKDDDDFDDDDDGERTSDKDDDDEKDEDKDDKDEDKDNEDENKKDDKDKNNENNVQADGDKHPDEGDADTDSDKNRDPEVTVTADKVLFLMPGTTPYPYFFLQKDGVWQAMDESGTPVTGTYNNVFLTHYDGSFLPLLTENGYEGYFLLPDGTLKEGADAGLGFMTGAEIYWNILTDAPVLICADPDQSRILSYDREEYLSYEEFYFNSEEYAAWAKPNVIPVRAVTGVSLSPADEYGWSTATPSYAHERYALFDLKTGTLLTDFVYSEAGDRCDHFGAIPMKKSTGWGYVNLEGREITEFIYENHDTEEWSGAHIFRRAANGYIPLKQNGLWGFCDLEGNVLFEPQFEEVTLANTNGVFFAEIANDTWGAFSLK